MSLASGRGARVVAGSGGWPSRVLTPIHRMVDSGSTGSPKRSWTSHGCSRGPPSREPWGMNVIEVTNLRKRSGDRTAGRDARNPRTEWRRHDHHRGIHCRAAQAGTRFDPRPGLDPVRDREQLRTLIGVQIQESELPDGCDGSARTQVSGRGDSSRTRGSSVNPQPFRGVSRSASTTLRPSGSGGRRSIH